MRYQLAVCYRIYPKVSRSPIFGFTDKLPLVKLNLKTFRDGLADLKAKVWVLLDNCPPIYERVVSEMLEGLDFELVKLPGIGNAATFGRQLEILSRQEAAEFVYFAEDDYLYLPGSIRKGVEFIASHPDVHFVSLYDHKDYYEMWFHRIPQISVESLGQKWVRRGSTCLTFLTTRKILQETLPVFETYTKGNSDLAVWAALTKWRVCSPISLIRAFLEPKFIWGSMLFAWYFTPRQVLLGPTYNLWVPTPSLATHMEAPKLAPGIDWEGIFGETARAFSHEYQGTYSDK